jgi:uncharacterized membrane protein YjgN (DUF898 family)
VSPTPTDAANFIGSMILFMLFFIPLMLATMVIIGAILRNRKSARVKRAAKVQAEAAEAVQAALDRIRS